MRKEKAKEKTVKKIATVEYLPHQFSDKEKQAIASDLALANQQKGEVESRKKQVVSELASEIAALDMRIKQQARLYNNGYEYRNIDCEARLHVPENGMKQIWRLDTGEMVKEIRMTSSELQEQLPFDGGDSPEEQGHGTFVVTIAPPAEAPVDAEFLEVGEETVFACDLEITDQPVPNPEIEEDFIEGNQTFTYRGVTVPYPSPAADDLMKLAHADTEARKLTGK